MTSGMIKTVMCASLLAGSLATMGCAKETYHEEQDKPRMLGGTKHEETTIKENPDGTHTKESETVKTR
jgi:hypothetical protein